MPNALRLIIGRKVSEEQWKLETVLKELLQEIETRERTSACVTNPPARRPLKDPTTVETFFSKGTTPQCCFCSQQHFSDKCQVVTGPEERKQALRKAGRCFLCLSKGHLSRHCRSKSRCSKCSGRHHRCICSGSADSFSSTPKETSSAGSSSGPSKPSPPNNLDPGAKPFQPPTTSMLVGTRGAVLLQTANVHIYDPDNPQNSMDVRAILDTRSQQSYTSQRVKDTLRLKPCHKQLLSVMTFASSDQQTQNRDVVRIGLATRDGTSQEVELFTVPFICQPLSTQPVDLCATKYDHLANLDLADPCHDGDGTPMEVDLLIGSDCYWNLVTGEIRRGEAGPVAIHTRLGWVLSGVAPVSREQLTSHSFLTTHVLRVDSTSPPETLNEILHSFWKLESLGIVDPEATVLDEFSQTVCFHNGRYQVSLPWKDSHPPLPDNFDLSNKRLQSLLRRLKQDPSIMHEYDSIIKAQLQQGIVEKVEKPESGASTQVHYLPHHAIVRRDKETTKVRIVYDASAKSTGCSLNECLHKGPKFDQKILDILLRFRTYQTAVTADIEKAFLMVSVTEEDRDVLRFLWVTDVTSDSPRVQVFRFSRVVFGVSSSPFLLNATLQHHLSQYSMSHPELVERLLKSMYVDDVVSGARNEEQAEQLYKEAKEILKQGGFNLRKFVTNSNTLQRKIDLQDGVNEVQKPQSSANVFHSEETYTKSTLGAAESTKSGEQKVLGVLWDVVKDELCFGFTDLAHCAAGMEPTKRNLVSIVGRFYDPIGFLAPIVISYKILFQRLCEDKRNWDQPLTGELLRNWERLVADLQSCPRMTLPRCIWPTTSIEDCSCTLHGFCDASKHAYAAVVYLVIRTPTEQFVTFIASKTRVAPLKCQTIPRLELLSILLARLLSSVSASMESELILDPSTCYTDSKVALFWIFFGSR